VIKPENPCYIKLANSWIVLNSGGGPTPDKPEVLLETPPNFNRVSSFLFYVSRTSGPVTNNGATKARSFSLSRSTAKVGNGVATCAIQTAT